MRDQTRDQNRDETRDETLEAELRVALHSEADGLPVRLTAAGLRVLARPAHPWWSLSAAMVGATLVVAAVLIAVVALGPPAPDQVGRPLPSPPATRPSSPAAATRPTASPTPATEARAPFGPRLTQIVARPTEGDLEVAALWPDGTIRHLATVPDYATWLSEGYVVERAQPPEVSPTGFLSLSVPAVGQPDVTLIFDLQQPTAEPLAVPDLWRGIWGPTDLIAMPGPNGQGIIIVDPRDGTRTTLDVSDVTRIYWDAAGTGFWVVAQAPEDIHPNELAPDWLVARHILLDGTEAPSPQLPALAAPLGPVTRPAGAGTERIVGECASDRSACLAVFDPIERTTTVWSERQTLYSEWQWDSEGMGLWAIEQTSPDDSLPDRLRLRLAHYDAPGHADRVADLSLPSGPSFGEVALAPDDSWLTIGTADGRVFVWDIEAERGALVGEIGAELGGWHPAGWGPGFPTYPSR